LAPTITSMTIMIAEDNSVSRVITQKSVEKLGYKTVLADTGSKAWDIFQKHSPEIIISDWMMPEMDGIELCRRVRARHESPYTYFILLTTLSEKKDFYMATQVGVDDYLTKPLDRDQLEARLLSASRITTMQRHLLDQKAELQRMNHELSQRLGDPRRASQRP
jgi:CheY-like chemotaxis protein